MVISIGSRVIRNRLLARGLAVFVFAMPPCIFWDFSIRRPCCSTEIALQLGEFRLSALLVVRVLVVLFVLTSLAVMVSRLVEEATHPRERRPHACNA
ncbi:MAG: hypothetical protein R3F54_02540 [Alphaproteobacteria bacterium]